MNLTEDFRKKRGTWLVNEIRQAVRDRSDLDQKLQLIRSLYFMDKDPLASLPWVGASDIHLPVIYEKVETAVPKVMNAFWGTEPIVHVKRVPSEYMPEETDNAERLVNWGVEEDIFPNFYATSEDWFRNTLRDGMSTLKICWRRAWEKTVEVYKIKALYEAGDTTVFGVDTLDARPKTAEEIFYEIFGRPNYKHGLLTAMEMPSIDVPENPDAPIPELIGTQWALTFTEERRRLQGRAVFMSSEYVDEIDVHVYRQVLKHDHPQVEIIEHEDLIVPFRTQDVQTADWVAQQYWLTKEEVESQHNDGVLDITKDEFDRLMAKRSVRVEEMEENEDLKRQKDRVIGEGVKEQRHQTATQDGDSEEDRFTDNNKFLFFEVYICDDVDGDGDPIEVVYKISYDLKSIVRYDYLSELIPHGRRPFATIKYKSISGRWYGSGMGEVLVPINLEVNTIVNFVNNNQELINNPFFFYIPAATMVDPGVMQGVAPGDGIPIGDINGVFFPKFQQEPLANLSAMDTLLLFADRITISPMNAGSPQVRNAPRTARGTMALLSEGNIQLDNLISNWQRTGWEELMHQLMGLYQSFMPEEKYMYVTGDDGVLAQRRVSLKEIRGRWMFTFTGNTINTNREMLRSIAMQRYQLVMTHPDYAQDPNVRAEALRDVLRHMSEGVDIDRLIPAKPGQGGYSHPPMSQESENQAMTHGLSVDVLPTDDHAAHLKTMEVYSRSQAFELLSEDRVILFAMHQKQHIEQLQQQTRMDTQSVAPGQGNNLSATDLGNFEGGVQ